MKLINIYRDQYTVIPREVVFDKRLDYRRRLGNLSRELR